MEDQRRSFGESGHFKDKINPLPSDGRFKSTERGGGRTARNLQESFLKVQGQNRAVTPN